MGIALLTLADLFTPLQTLANRWMPARRAHRNALRYVAVRPACAARPMTASAVSPAVRPLRVVRVVDPQRAGRASGRVVISGRMADVCDELDRLAALEAADELHHLVH